MPAPVRVPLPIIGAVLAFGLLGVVIGGGLVWSSWRHLNSAGRADGTVIELVAIASRKGLLAKGQPTPSKPSRTPLVEYQVDGQTHRVRGQVSSASCPYTVGDRVTVVYPPDRPGEGKLDSLSENWLAPLVIGAAGLLFVLIGVGMLHARRAP